MSETLKYSDLTPAMADIWDDRDQLRNLVRVLADHLAVALSHGHRSTSAAYCVADANAYLLQTTEPETDAKEAK